MAHCIWAAVVLTVVGACFWAHLRTTADSAAHRRVSDMEHRVSGHQHTVARLDSDFQTGFKSLAAEVDRIREGLEKLKAIPPKQPRL